MRSLESIHRLIPDPGLSFQLAAREGGPADWFGRFGGYPQVLPRILSEILALVPLAHLTYWATVTNALLISLCALIVTTAIQEHSGLKIAVAAGLVLVGAFPAFEGLIGNIWAIRWVLLPTTCVVAASSITKTRPIVSLVLFLVTGLSHAYIVVPAAAYMFRLYADEDRKLQDSLLGIALASTGLFQAFMFLDGSRQARLYGDSTIYWPWHDAGVYWWSVFLVPIVVSLLAVTLAISEIREGNHVLSAPSLMAFQAVLLASLAYGQLGIKSSPAVATVPLAASALLVSSGQVNKSKLRKPLPRILLPVVMLGILVLSARYYFASSYLTSGPMWIDVVAKALAQCRPPDVGQVQLTYFRAGDLSNSELLSCDAVFEWNKWFFRR